MVFSPRECDKIRETFLDSESNVNYEDMAEIYLGKNYSVSVDSVSVDGDFVDDDFSFLSAMNIPENSRIQFGNICCSRWMSFVRQAE